MKSLPRNCPMLNERHFKFKLLLKAISKIVNLIKFNSLTVILAAKCYAYLAERQLFILTVKTSPFLVRNAFLNSAN